MKGKTIQGLITFWLLAWASIICEASDIITVQSGSWTSASTWAGGAVPVQGDQAIIKSGHTVTIPSSGTKACTNLIVENGGKLYANTGGSQRYVDIYGNITCDGTIGNNQVLDGISFNIEGPACLVSGNGSFDASRMRKNTGVNSSTTLTIGMNMNLRFNGTALYNNKSASNFHIIINPNCTVGITGNAGTPGNVCIDGSNASNGSSYGGSITVNGTLNVSGILYLTTDNNSSAYSVSFTINSGGEVNTASVICTNSGSACHYTSINDGGKLNFTSGDWGTFGLLYNFYNFSGASTIEYSGSGLQNVGNQAVYGNLVLSGSGEKQACPGELIVNGDLNIQNGCRLVIPQSVGVTLQGDLYLNSADGIVLKAGNNDNAPGSFIVHGIVSGSGTLKAEKFMTKYLAPDDGNYHLISSPVTAQDIQPEFVTEPPENSTDFYRWDQPLSQWVNSKTAAGLWNTSFQPGDQRTFKPGTGYLVAYANDVTKCFSGNIANESLDVPVTYSPGNYAGFNLIGNPYTSAMNADIHTWNKTNVQNAIWVWDPASGNYKTWNGLTGTLAGGIIPAMQGFFIKAIGPSPSLVIPESSRMHSNQPSCKSLATALVLKTRLTGGRYSDETVLYIPRPLSGPPGTIYDVQKLSGYKEAPQLYQFFQSKKYSILQIDTLYGSSVIPLGIKKGSTDTLRFDFTGIETFTAEDVFTLEDRLEGVSVDLREQPFYNFISRSPDENSRFFLHYRNTSGTYSPTILNQVKLYSEKGDLRIVGLEEFLGCEMLEIYDMSGKRVTEQLIPPGIERIRLNLAPANYVVRISLGKAWVSKKLSFIK